MSAGTSNFDLQAMRQELRSNPKTQIALAAFGLVMIYALYTLLFADAPKGGRKAAATRTLGSNLDPRQLQGLRRLPDLAALGKAGELPPAAKIQRDLFMFEAPPPPPPPQKPPPPPPQPTEAELEAKRKQEEEAREYASRPQDLRYLGYFKGAPSGAVGAFMKGEEPVTLTSGTVLKERWKLVSILDTKAEFQNTKYPKMRLVLEVRETSGGGPVNQF